MKQTIFILTLWFLILTGLTTSEQAQDTTRQISTSQKATLPSIQKKTDYDESNDFAPGLLFGAIIVLGFILVCIGAGIALTIFGLLIVFGLVSFGILSTSLIVALNRKSFAKGFKTFIVLSSTVGGLLIFGAGSWILNRIVHWSSNQAVVSTGIICGLVAGLAFGYLANYILQRLTNYFKSKLNLT